MNVGIVGSRNHPSGTCVRNLIGMLHDKCRVVSGGAKGIDTWAEYYAKQKGLECVIHKPEWTKFGKSAGFKRNILIVRDSDIIFAFPYGEARGTKHTIYAGKQCNKLVIVCNYDGTYEINL